MDFGEVLSILSVVASIVTSFLVARFYSERWVEMAERRREHSVKLNDAVLKPWKNKVEEYCKIDAMYSSDIDKIIGVEPKDPVDLEFYDAARSHLKLKNPDVLKAWEELKIITSNHNKERALILERIRTLILKQFEMPRYYWSPGAEKPEEYIRPAELAENIYHEIEWREPNKRKWARGAAPYVQPSMSGDKRFYHLMWNSTLMESLDKSDAEKALLLINSIIDTPKLRDEVKDMKKRENETYGVKKQNFETKIKDVIDSVELGNNLGGKCRFCR